MPADATYFISKYSSTQIEAQLDKINNLDQTHYNKEGVNNLLESKVDTSSMSGYYTKAQVDALVSQLSTMQYQNVAALPTGNDISFDVIYRVKTSKGKTNNKYREYYRQHNYDYSVASSCTVVSELPSNGSSGMRYLILSEGKVYEYDGSFNESETYTCESVASNPIPGDSSVLYYNTTDNKVYECSITDTWEIYGDSEIEFPQPTILTQTLAANATSVTFTNVPTTGDNLIDFFTSIPLDYTDIIVSTPGQITLVYPAQESAVTVYCRIEAVPVSS